MRRRQLPRQALLAALALPLLLTASPARAEDRIFWVNNQSNTISFSPLNGDPGGTLVTGNLAPAAPTGLSFDRGSQRVFWLNGATARISAADFAGTESESLETDAASLVEPIGLSVDPAGGRVYWANSGSNRISYSHLDGSLGGDLPIGAPALVRSPSSVAVDPGSGRVYWTNALGLTPISYANLDGSGGGTLAPAQAPVNVPVGIAVDDIHGRVYWANLQGPSGAGSISYANLDGSGGGTVSTAGATVGNPIGLALDPVAGRIYWANSTGNRIGFANLDGSGGQDLRTTGLSPSNPRFPMLLVAPRAAGPASVRGGSRAGATLACVANWLPDLPAASFYDAPDSLSYQWSRDGGDIPGATRPTLSATSEPGNYACRVVASNRSGQSVQSGGPHTLTPIAFGKEALVTLRLATRLLAARAPLRIEVANANAFEVSGQLAGRSVKGGAKVRFKPFRVAAHSKLTVRAELPGRLRRRLSRRGSVRLALEADLTDLAGNERTVEKTLTARAKR